MKHLHPLHFLPFKVGKEYKTVNKSRVKCLSKKNGQHEFEVISGGHGIVDGPWAGELPGGIFTTNSEGVYCGRACPSLDIIGFWEDEPADKPNKLSDVLKQNNPSADEIHFDIKNIKPYEAIPIPEISQKYVNGVMERYAANLALIQELSQDNARITKKIFSEMVAMYPDIDGGRLTFQDVNGNYIFFLRFDKTKKARNERVSLLLAALRQEGLSIGEIAEEFYDEE